MIKKLTILVILFISQIIFAQKAVGYYYASNTSYPHTAIDYENLTHIAHSFIYPTEEGELLTDPWFHYPELVSTAKANGVKIIVAIGGWGNSEGFPPMAADSVKRTNFINNVVKFCTDYGYQGIDLDWEYPKSEDRENFVTLVKELREAFDQNGIEIISGAMPSQDWNNGYDIAKLKDYMDWFGIMTYDFSGPWESVAGFNSPLYKHPQQWGSIDNSIKYYQNKGVPNDQLLMGMPFYGYRFLTSDPFKSFTEAASIPYANANTLKNSAGYNYYFNETNKQPYLQDDDKTVFITYDDTVSLKLKCDYIHKMGIGGTIIWKVGHDYASGNTPLLDVVGDYLLNPSTDLPEVPSLVFPGNEHLFDTTRIELNWKGVKWATTYNVQIAEDSAFTTLHTNKSNISLEKLAIKNLTEGKTYFWRVASKNKNGSSDWSSIQKFKINEVTSIDDEESQVSSFTLRQNYPNPFNPTTVISYSLPKSGNVKLSVYNMLGQQIEVLIDGFVAKGNHKISFNAEELTSGVYYYVLKTKDNLESKKMIYLK